MGTRKNEWGWPDVRTGECAALSGRMDRYEEQEDDVMAELAAWDPMGRGERRNDGFGGDVPLPATLTDADVGVNVVRGSRHEEQDIGNHGPLTDADVGVNVYRGSRGDEGGGIPEYVVRGSSVGDEWLDALMREDLTQPEQDGNGNVRLCQAGVEGDSAFGGATASSEAHATKTVLHSGNDMDWDDFEWRKATLLKHAQEIRAYVEGRGPEPTISSARYNQLFKTFVKLVVSYFRKRRWERAADAYEKYLNVEVRNTDVGRFPFAEVKDHIKHTPAVQSMFADWRKQAMRYARSQPCDDPQPEPLDTVIVPVSELAYARHIELGLILGHYAVSARVAPRGSAGVGKMKWQLYFEVTPESARFDFSDPDAIALPIPRVAAEVNPALTRAPAVIFWAAETWSRGAEAFPVYSHELSEEFVCECSQRK